MTPTPATPCPSCRHTMQRIALHGHYGRTVDVDQCTTCHLLWFDQFESVNLAGRGVLDLLRSIDAAHAQAHTPLAARLACPRCDEGLRHVHNLTGVSRTAQHECPRGHGAAQSFSLYLGEKGFVRPLLRPEVERMRAASRNQPTACINCGGPFDPAHAEACSFCGAPVRVLDVLPLARAVDRQTGQLDALPATGAQAAAQSFPCGHCGAAVDPMLDHACRACSMPVAITDLGWALKWMEPLLKAVEEGQATDAYRDRHIAAVQSAAPSERVVIERGTRFRLPVGYEVYTAVVMALFFLLAWYYGSR